MIYYKCKKCGDEVNKISSSSACQVCGGNLFGKYEKYHHLIFKAANGKKITFWKSGEFTKFLALKFGEEGKAVGSEQFKITMKDSAFFISQGSKFSHNTLVNSQELNSSSNTQLATGDEIRIAKLVLTTQIEEKNELIDDIEL